jgi:hypothetical protein
MMRPGALPLSQLIVLDLLVPPIGTCIWWLMSRGWAGFVQGGAISENTRKRQKREFWSILIAAYLLMFGITIYGYLT